MRILVYGVNFPPEQIGIGKYTGEMAAWLAERGHEVRVVTAPPWYPAWRVMEGDAGGRYQRERWQGITLWRCPIWVPRNPAGIKRILQQLSFALSSAPVVLRQAFWRPDVVLMVAPPLACTIWAWLIARLSGAQTWLHVQDFEVDMAFETGLLRLPALRRFALWAERQLMSRFDRVSTISPNMIARLIDKGVTEKRCVLFPNWVDTEAIRPLHGYNPFRGELGISDDVTVALYSGNMGEKQGLETVLEAARRLNGEDSLCFVLCGEGASRKRLIQKYGDLSTVIWLPLQPVERLNELLNLADVHLLPQRADVADLVMPSKLLGMLASGRPVLATAEPETQVAQMVLSCGKVVKPGDAASFAQALLQLARTPQERKRLGEMARQAAHEWDKEQVLGNFECELSALYGR